MTKISSFFQKIGWKTPSQIPGPRISKKIASGDFLLKRTEGPTQPLATNNISYQIGVAEGARKPAATSGEPSQES